MKHLSIVFNILVENTLSTAENSTFIIVRKLLHIWVTRGTRNPLLKNTIIHILLTGTVCKPITIIGVRREAVLISFDFSRLSLLCRLCGSGGCGCILRFCCDLRKIGAYRLGRCSYLRLVGRYGDSRLCCLGCSRCGFRGSGFFFRYIRLADFLGFRGRDDDSSSVSYRISTVYLFSISCPSPPMSVRSMSCALLEQPPTNNAVAEIIMAAVTSLSVVCFIFRSSLV